MDVMKEEEKVSIINIKESPMFSPLRINLPTLQDAENDRNALSSSSDSEVPVVTRCTINNKEGNIVIESQIPAAQQNVLDYAYFPSSPNSNKPFIRNETPEEKRLKQKLIAQKVRLKNKTKQIKSLQRTLYRLKKRNKCLKEILTQFKNLSACYPKLEKALNGRTK